MLRPPLFPNTQAARGACAALVRPYGNGALSTCSMVKLSPRQMTGSDTVPRIVTNRQNNIFNTVANYGAERWRVDWNSMGPFIGGLDAARSTGILSATGRIRCGEPVRRSGVS